MEKSKEQLGQATSPSPDYRSQALTDAFEKLPIHADVADASFLINNAVKALLKNKLRDHDVVPAKFVPNDKKTLQELRQLEKLSNQLASHIDEKMHETSIVAMEHWGDRLLLVNLLKSTAENAKLSAEKEAKKQVSPPHGDQKTEYKSSYKAVGRSQKPQSRAITMIITYYYQQLTNQPPTLRRNSYSGGSELYGPYFEHLRDIFKILGIKSSAENYAKEAIKNSKQAKGKTTSNSIEKIHKK